MTTDNTTGFLGAQGTGTSWLTGEPVARNSWQRLAMSVVPGRLSLDTFLQAVELMPDEPE